MTHFILAFVLAITTLALSLLLTFHHSSSFVNAEYPLLQRLKQNIEGKHNKQRNTIRTTKQHQQDSSSTTSDPLRRDAALNARVESQYPSANIPDIAPLRTDTVTLSGFDGGASFAQQFHIAYSSVFRGGAFLSTIPYLCAEGTLAGSTNCLENPWLINNAALFTEAATFALEGTVDAFSNLKDQYVRIGASPDDSLVNSGGSRAAAAMYASYLHAGSVETDFALDGANHAWVTSKYGDACGVLAPPYINNCKTSFALDSMTKLFQHMNLPVKPAASTFNQSRLYTMSQKNFGAIPTANSLASKGFVFVPPQCVRGASSNNSNNNNNNSTPKCHFHIHFHGCNQSSAVVFDQYALSTQLNEFAVENDVVIWYPQAAPNVEFLNPMGCFDFYGYEYGLPYPLAYATKVGGQMKIMKTALQAFLDGFI